MHIPSMSMSSPDVARQLRQAKVDLKKSKRKDYYKLLETNKDASQPELKKAYRKMALVSGRHRRRSMGCCEAGNTWSDCKIYMYACMHVRTHVCMYTYTCYTRSIILTRTTSQKRRYVCVIDCASSNGRAARLWSRAVMRVGLCCAALT